MALAELYGVDVDEVLDIYPGLFAKISEAHEKMMCLEYIGAKSNELKVVRVVCFNYPLDNSPYLLHSYLPF